MNHNKYYKVVKSEDVSGNIQYQALACSGIIAMIFREWTLYAKIHRTLEDAIEHINTLAAWKAIKESVVYRRKVTKTK